MKDHIFELSKFQLDREFEGHGFVGRMTVMCYPRKNKVDLFILFTYNCGEITMTKAEKICI